jgi:hypothetical protein
MGTSTATGVAPATTKPGPAVHDFDFYMGTWRVRHRRLKERLAGNDEWQEFEGTSTAWPILDGAGNIDDNVLRFVWSNITDTTCRWEQAFSPDGGETWEVNWIMESTRIA